MPLSEADTSRKFIIPRFQVAGWENDPHALEKELHIIEIVGRIKTLLEKPI